MSEGAKERQQPARIVEVAALAGVSTATVSRALSAPGKLRPETLARVTEAVRRTGYTPYLPARGLRAGRTMTALVVVPDIGNPFFSDVLRGMEEALSQGGYGLLIGNLGRSRDREARIARLVQAGQVDGLLLLNGHIPDGGDGFLAAAGVPMVAVCEAIPDAAFPQVEACNREAAREAVAHLVALGHRRLGYISGPADNILDRERRAGFREGLAEAGLSWHSAPHWPGDFSFQAGEAAAADFLRRRQRPTGIFAANDEMAIGFIKAVRAAALRVPEDVSVIGFDGIAFADYVEPVLTTFRQPRRDLGKTGAELLLRMMAGETIGPGEAHVRLPAPLLARASCGPAPVRTR